MHLDVKAVGVEEPVKEQDVPSGVTFGFRRMRDSATVRKLFRHVETVAESKDLEHLFPGEILGWADILHNLTEYLKLDREPLGAGRREVYL